MQRASLFEFASRIFDFIVWGSFVVILASF